MANIDKLKEEAIDIRTFKFIIVSIIIMLFAGLGSLYMRLIESDSPLIVIGMVIILILVQGFGIMYHKYSKNYQVKLEELKNEKSEE